MKKPDGGTILFGVLLIVIGVGSLSKSFGFDALNLFFDGWWLYLIILFALADMVKNRISFLNCLAVFFCVWELLYRYGVIVQGVSFAVIFALLFILWGIHVIFGGMSTETGKVCVCKTQTYSASGQTIEQVCCVLGHSILDLRGGTYQSGQAVKVKCVLGSVEVLVPSAWKVSPVCSGKVMGTFSDRTDFANNQEKEIILDYSIVMGSVALRSKGEN